MRPGYRQFCAVARTLDLIGQRWTLLVVRELALRGSLPAAALARGLPDVPMNQLTQRLAELQAAGLVRCGEDQEYSLTGDGHELEEVLGALARFGLERLSLQEGDAVLPHVLMRQLQLRLEAAAEAPAGRFELRLTDPESMWSVEPGLPAPDRWAIVVRPGGASVRAGACLDPDAVLTMSVAACAALVAAARPEGVEVQGSAARGAALLEALAPPRGLAAAA